MNQSQLVSQSVCPSGRRLDHEVLSLREAAGHRGSGQCGPDLGPEDRLRLLQQHEVKVQH